MKYPSTMAAKLRAVALLLSTTLGAAQAMSLREFRALIQSDPQGENYANYYLVGVLEGAVEAHLNDQRQGARPVLCLNGRAPPPVLARTLFDAELERHPDTYEADMPVQLVLTHALVAHYACK